VPSPPNAQAPRRATNQEREVAEDLRAKVAAAREQATKAGGERFAGPSFTAAAGHQSEAEAALASGRVADAQAAYRRALDGFSAAADEAQSAVALKRDETRRRQKQVEAARVGTVHPDKPPVDAVPRDGPPVVASSGARADAEQARSAMVAAKSGAEQVAAGFFANRRYASAQGKERDGLAAFKQSDYVAAGRLLLEAQAEYQAAAEDARREAPLRISLDRAQSAANAQRQQALAAQADDLAKDLFDLAQARHGEADGLSKRQDLDAAARAYQDAAERYREATLQARASRAAK